MSRQGRWLFVDGSKIRELMKDSGIRGFADLFDRIVRKKGCPDDIDPISKDTLQRAGASCRITVDNAHLIADALDVDLSRILLAYNQQIESVLVKAIETRWKERCGRVQARAAAKEAASRRFHIIACALEDIIEMSDISVMIFPCFADSAALLDFTTSVLLAYEALPLREDFDSHHPRDIYDSFRDSPKVIQEFKGDKTLALGVLLALRPGSNKMEDYTDATLNGELNGMRDFLIYRIACIPEDLEPYAAFGLYEWTCLTSLGIEIASLQGGRRKGELDLGQLRAIKAEAHKKLKSAFASMR